MSKNVLQFFKYYMHARVVYVYCPLLVITMAFFAWNYALIGEKLCKIIHLSDILNSEPNSEAHFVLVIQQTVRLFSLFYVFRQKNRN